MTVTLPPWEAWPLAALTILGASTLASLATAPILRRRAGGQPAPGDGQAPVPGEAASTARPPLSPLRPPPPAPGHHDHGARLLTSRFFEDGCVLVWDGSGQLTASFEATHPLDAEIRKLLS